MQMLSMSLEYSIPTLFIHNLINMQFNYQLSPKQMTIVTHKKNLYVINFRGNVRKVPLSLI